MSETTEKKLTGLAALNEKRRLEKLQNAGIKAELKTLPQQENKQEDKPKQTMETLEEKKKEFIPTDELDFGIDPNKVYVFQTIKKSSSPRHQMFTSRGKIFDGKRIRAIRYVPIADSIFVDEQGTMFDEYTDPILSFHNDMIMVDGTDKRLVEFLLSHDEYDGNKHRLSKMPPMYTLVNKYDAEDRKEAYFVQKKKALNVIDDNSMEELFPIARVVFNIMDEDPTTVKNKLREYAETNPKKILDGLDSPRIKRGYVIQSALDKGIIEVMVNKKSLVWAVSKTFIMEIRAVNDLDAQVNEITDYMFTDNGNKVYDVIKQKLKN
jgi:hypothetical protein